MEFINHKRTDLLCLYSCILHNKHVRILTRVGINNNLIKKVLRGVAHDMRSQQVEMLKFHKDLIPVDPSDTKHHHYGPVTLTTHGQLIG